MTTPRVEDWETHSCPTCGLSHTPVERQRRIKRMLPATVKEMRDAYPCVYGPSDDVRSSLERRLYRDLHRIGAVRDHGTWRLP